MKHPATIVRISHGQVVYAKDPSRTRLVGFALGKISNYHGETAQELSSRGLRKGNQIFIEYDDDNQQIRSVDLSVT